MSEGNSNIATLLNQILTAIYGKDVRKSIHDAIQQCYSDVGDPALNEAAFKKAVQEKIDDGSIGALTLGEGSIETKFIKNKAVTSEKIADDVTVKIDKNAMNIDSLKDEIDMANNKIVVASSEQEIKDDGKFYLYNGHVYYYNNGKLVQGTEYTLVVPNNQIAIKQYDTVMIIGNAVNEYAFNEADNGTFVWRNL